MRPFIVFLLLSVSFLSHAQQLVEFKVLESKESVEYYFNVLAMKANCTRCTVKKQVDKNGNLVLSLELPSSEQNVMAFSILATFYYDKEKKNDICFNFLVAGNNRNVESYLNFVREKCTKNEEGNFWEYNTGVMNGSKKVFCIYRFNDDRFPSDECCFTLNALLVNR